MNNVKLKAKPVDVLLNSENEFDSKLKISIHTDSNAISELYEPWTNLADKSNQIICMSPEWVSCWWKHFGINKWRSLYIITVYSDEKLVAIFPFYKGVSSIGGIKIEQRLQIIGSGGSPNEKFGFTDDYGISDFLDFIVDPEYNVSVTELFISLLTKSNLAAHHIAFHQVRDDSFIKQYLYPELLKVGINVKTEQADTCPIIHLNGLDNLDDFIKQKKSSARRRFRQTLRAIGPKDHYEIEDGDSLNKIKVMTKDLIELHQTRWNDLGFPGVFHDERFKNFFEDMIVTAYDKKWLWFKQAVDSEGVCAGRMLLLYHNRYYDYISGFNDNSPSAKYRPGIGLLLNLIDDALGQSVESVELLRGKESYKHDFTQNSINNWKITIPASKQSHVLWKVPVAITHTFSHLYKYYNREKQLMKVQYQKAGYIKMITGYIQFRSRSVSNKIKALFK